MRTVFYGLYVTVGVFLGSLIEAFLGIVAAGIVGLLVDLAMGDVIRTILAQIGLWSVISPLWQVGVTIGFLVALVRVVWK
jgi:hypothetical protein